MKYNPYAQIKYIESRVHPPILRKLLPIGKDSRIS